MAPAAPKPHGHASAESADGAGRTGSKRGRETRERVTGAVPLEPVLFGAFCQRFSRCGQNVCVVILEAFARHSIQRPASSITTQQ